MLKIDRIINESSQLSALALKKWSYSLRNGSHSKFIEKCTHSKNFSLI